MKTLFVLRKPKLRPRRDGPVAVITGASAGVGRATAIELARRGWRIALLARSELQLESAVREIRKIGSSALSLVVDVADAEAVFGAADRVNAEWGGIDLWINNAMVTLFAPIAETAPEEFRRVTEVSYLGQVNGTLAALKHMRPVDKGTILQVGSALSYRSIPLQSAYCAAKFAVRGFTDSLRTELAHERSNIRVTMVQLPAVNTPQFDWAHSHLPRRLQPVPPIYQPEAVACAIVRAAMRPPRELWIGIPVIRAIVGNMVAPGLLDRVAAKVGWEGQLADEPAVPGRPDNLFHPVACDPGVHGRFGARSRQHVVALPGGAVRTLFVATLTIVLAGVFCLGTWLGASSARGQRSVREQTSLRRQ